MTDDKVLMHYCHGCGYDLRMLPAGVCPECGRPFDPADPRSTRRRPRGRRWGGLFRWALRLTLLGVVMWSMPVGWLWWECRSEQPAIRRAAELGYEVDSERLDLGGMARFLPQRWMYLLERVRNIAGVGGKTAGDADLVLFGRCRKLALLWIPARNISDDGVEALAGLHELGFLDRVEGPNLTDRGMAHLRKCTKLWHLSVGGSIGAKGLDDITSLPALKDLLISSDLIVDQDLDRLRRLPRLQILYLDTPRIGDAGLAILARIDTLGGIVLASEQPTDEGIAEFKKKKTSRAHLDVGIGPNRR